MCLIMSFHKWMYPWSGQNVYFSIIFIKPTKFLCSITCLWCSGSSTCWCCEKLKKWHSSKSTWTGCCHSWHASYSGIAGCQGSYFLCESLLPGNRSWIQSCSRFGCILGAGTHLAYYNFPIEKLTKLWIGTHQNTKQSYSMRNFQPGPCECLIFSIISKTIHV